MTQSTVDNSRLQTFLLRPIAASLLLPLVGSQEKIAQTSLPEPFGLSLPLRAERHRVGATEDCSLITDSEEVACILRVDLPV